MPPLRTDVTSNSLEGIADQLRQIFWLGPMICLGGRVGAHITGDLDSNPGPGENFSLKLTTKDLPDGYSENQSFINNLPLCVFNTNPPFKGMAT